MSTVGDNNFDIMRGLPQTLRLRVDIWEVPGLPGVGAQTLGMGDAEFELATVVYVFAADEDTPASAVADTLIAACNALQGTLTTVVDDWGTTFTNVLVKKVDTSGMGAKRPCIKDGVNGVRVEVHWSMVTAA